MIKKIQLSDHFGYRKLLRFTIPSMLMMVFTSIYSIVDGAFVSNFVGTTPFAAINLIMPFLMFLGVVGTMLGTGGSALIAKTLGEGQKDKANRIFSMLILVAFISGIVLAAIGIIFLRQISIFLGADVDMLEYCISYGRIILIALPFMILQYMFQPLMVAAERPRLGLVVTVLSGIMNIILDYVLIVVFGWGLNGAAIATAVSQLVGGMLPILYFLFPNKSLLRIVKPEMDMKALGQACFNGMSEFFGNLSGSVVSMCYNFQLMKYFGENGVAAYGVIMYVQFIFFAVFLGYAVGSAPIISYHYGAQNHEELHNVYQRSLKLIGFMGIVLTLSLELFAGPLTKIFVGYDEALFALTRRAFRIYGLSYLLVGFNFYASSFFTALNNGVISAIVATTRALVFETSAVFILPALFGADMIWLSVCCAEIMALIVSVVFLSRNQKIYHY